METVTIPRVEFEQMQREIVALRSTSLYKRLLKFEENITMAKNSTERI